MNAENDQFGIKKIFQDAVKLRAAENETLLNGSLSNFTIIADGDVLAYTFNSNPKPSILVVINFSETKEGNINLQKLKVKEGKLMLFTSAKERKEKDMVNIKVPPMALYVYKIKYLK